eukprot:SAG22_NODE_1969_length_3234_cov_2.212759_5_plen_239_part_00
MLLSVLTGGTLLTRKYHSQGFAGYAGADRVVPPERAAEYPPADPASIRYDPATRTFDCEPTLTDTQVLEFCRTGCILLPGVIPAAANEQTCAWLRGECEATPSAVPDGMTEQDMARIRRSHEPSTLLLEPWYIEQVLLAPQVAGAIRSLLGAHVGLPVLVSHHGGVSSGENPSQHWHQVIKRCRARSGTMHFIRLRGLRSFSRPLSCACSAATAGCRLYLCAGTELPRSVPLPPRHAG